MNYTNLMLHFTEMPMYTGATVYVGTGPEAPVCGQTGSISITSRPDLVECTKCKEYVRKFVTVGAES